MNPRNVQAIAVAFLVALALFSLHIATNRIFQVDEIQNVFMARIIGDNTAHLYYVNPELFLIGPLAWLAKNATSSADLLVAARVIFCGIFILNTVLMAKCAGAKLQSTKGLLILAAAATIAPFWDYGIEIRHENIMLTGMLIMLLMFRSNQLTTAKLLIIGSIASLMLFVTFKSVVYTAPIILIFLCMPSALTAKERFKRAAWIAMGAVFAFLILIALYASIGLLEVFVQRVMEIQVSAVSDTGKRFPPWKTLWRVVTQAPLLTACTIATLGAYFHAISRSATRKLDTIYQPETLIVLACFVAIFINPTPYPYNLINLLPFAFIAAFRYFDLDSISNVISKKHLQLTVAVVVICHLTPFLSFSLRHTEYNNWRQMFLAELAEKFTDEQSDYVYDATGMVVTRKAIGYWWFLHSLTVDRVYREKNNTVSSLLEQNPPAVIIRNYRYDWLSPLDRKYIEQNYVSLADDFLILGGTIQNQEAPYLARRTGRYQILHERNGALVPVKAVKIGGTEMTGSTVHFEVGVQHIEAEEGYPLRVLWIGNSLESVPTIPAGNRNHLFVNWY